MKTYWKIFPLAVIKEMGIKDMGIFNGTFSDNGNGKKIRKSMGKFHRWTGPGFKSGL